MDSIDQEKGISEEAPSLPSAALLTERFQEIFSYLSCYMSARIAQGKLSIKDTLWAMVGWGSLILVMIGILLTAIVFVFYGLSLWIGEVSGRPWAGYLATGLFFLLIPGLWLKIQRASAKKKSLKKEMEAYERTLAEQRSRYGCDLESRFEETTTASEHQG